MTETIIVPITYPEVISAARALESEGTRVTILAVRERIGRGSFSTVKKFLERWDEEREAGGASSRGTPLPASLETLWTEACKQAEESVAQERQVVEQLASDLEARFEQLRAEAAASESGRAQAEQRLADLQTELQRSYADVDELKHQRTELEQRLYGMLELAAQERHSFLGAIEQLGQINHHLATLSTATQAQLPPLSSLQVFAEAMPTQLQQLESRLTEAAAADRHRIAEQDAHWCQALRPLADMANQIATLSRVVRQRKRPASRPHPIEIKRRSRPVR